jgi:hypothetical protein
VIPAYPHGQTKDNDDELKKHQFVEGQQSGVPPPQDALRRHKGDFSI